MKCSVEVVFVAKDPLSEDIVNTTVQLTECLCSSRKSKGVVHLSISFVEEKQFKAALLDRSDDSCLVTVVKTLRYG